MSRIRTIKPEFFRHEALYELELETGMPMRIAFAGLWTVCDREGRFKWRPRSIKLDVLPYDDIDFSRVLDALATRGFIVKYTSHDGSEFGYVPSFNRHQVINNRELKSSLPDPSDCEQLQQVTPRVPHACPTRQDLDQGEGEGEGERKGKELGTNVPLGQSVPDQPKTKKQIDVEFNTFWSVWPKRVAKGEARKALAQALKRAPLNQIMSGLRLACEHWQRNGTEHQYIPHPATWLRNDQWLDEHHVSVSGGARAGPSGKMSKSEQVMRARQEREERKKQDEQFGFDNREAGGVSCDVPELRGPEH